MQSQALIEPTELHQPSRPEPTGLSPILRLALRHALVIGLIAMVLVFSLAEPAFISVGNVRNILLASSILAVVAVPSALLILSGYLDLSVGSNLALGAMTTGILMTNGVHPVVAALGGIGAATLVGVLNGALVCGLGLSAIIVTLGTLTFVRGLALAVDSSTIFGFSEGFTELGRGGIAGVPYLVMVAALAFVIGWVFLERSAYGRHVHAIGVNPEAAYLSGIAVRGLPFWLFVATGAAVGVASVMYAARIASVTPAISGVAFELDVLTAVLLGGVAFGGGRGNMLGVLLGVLFLGVLQNGLTILDAPTAVALMVKGLALAVAAGLDIASRRAETA
jgi:ribose transport system permease protein